MTSHVFIRDGGDSLRAMKPVSFTHEWQLDRYVELYPELLSIALSTPDEPVRLLLIERQARIDDRDSGRSGRWSADLLFLDQHGILTIVEDKLSHNPELRRAVVGQLIEYAANVLASFTVDGIRQRLQRTSNDVAEAVAELTDGAEETFWEEVETSLQAGRIRLVFVADALAPELRRIIEFLNAYMKPVEVLGVEIARMRDDPMGGDTEVLVSSVVGRMERKQAIVNGQYVELSTSDFLTMFKAIDDGSTLGQATNRIAEHIFSLGTAITTRAWLTPSGDVCGCSVFRTNDSLELLRLKAYVSRIRRFIEMPSDWLKWPSDVRRSAETIFGFVPSSQTRGLEAKECAWLASRTENVQILMDWLSQVAASA